MSTDLTNPAYQTFKTEVTTLGRAMENHPNAIHVEPVHRFATNMYSRELTMPAGSSWVSRVHKHDNFAVVLHGECIVISEHGTQLCKAGDVMVTKAGTQRALKIHPGMDCVWITFHYLPSPMSGATNIDEIEDYYACDTLDEYEQLLLTGEAQKEIAL